MEGEEKENIGPFRRTTLRTRRMATRMAAALASSDNRIQAALARLEALESDNTGVEVVDLNDDEYGSMDEEDQILMQKKQSKSMKRKTRQGRALEKRVARSFMDVLHEANLESLPPHVPTYLRAAVGSPSTSSRRHYCSVCGNTANYTCVSRVAGHLAVAPETAASPPHPPPGMPWQIPRPGVIHIHLLFNL